ncbi:MAG: DinB family protein [Planctomycetia bacterium]
MWVERYESDASLLPAAVAGLTPAERNAPTSAGGWTIQEIVLHLMESDLIATDRMKRIVAELEPLLVGYDENAWSRMAGREELDAAMAADVFHKNRLLTAAFLRAQPDEAFARVGRHTERGPVSLRSMLETYTNHFRHHLAFLVRKRALLNRPIDGGLAERLHAAGLDPATHG